MPRNSIVRVYNGYTNFTNPHFQSPFAQTGRWKPSKKRGKRKPVKKAVRR